MHTRMHPCVLKHCACILMHTLCPRPQSRVLCLFIYSHIMSHAPVKVLCLYDYGHIVSQDHSIGAACVQLCTHYVSERNKNAVFELRAHYVPDHSISAACV